ncbi:hypothetical protein D9M72_500580 [compost metagenome]
MDSEFLEGGPLGHRQPLSGRVDQVAHLVHGEKHAEVAAALEGHHQGVAGLDRAAGARDLVKAWGEGAAFVQGVGGVEQVVAKIVNIGHRPSNLSSLRVSVLFCVETLRRNRILLER